MTNDYNKEENTIKTKNDLRKEYIKLRSNLSNKEEKSNIIISKILDTDIYKQSKKIGLYKATLNEVNLDNLISVALKDEKEVYIPKVLDDSKMELYRINSISDIKNLSKYNIYEPEGMIEASTLDLIIVPGIVFDKALYRIGYGKGYYDRYLKNKNTYKLGVVFKECLIDYIPHDEFDIRMDNIITD